MSNHDYESCDNFSWTKRWGEGKSTPWITILTRPQRSSRHNEVNIGYVSTRDNRVLTGHSFAHYVCSLAPLTPLTNSAALRFPMLAFLARSVHGLAHSPRSLPRGTVNFLNMCSCCERIWREETRFWSSLETHPLSQNWNFMLTHIHFYSLRFIGNFLIMKNIHIQKKVAKTNGWKKKAPSSGARLYFHY